ncbi:MAG: YjjW family glycine radical enzyme activase [Spirochaetaceae bacterium]|nr:YjjW family glycine radical enzyme activase [Spirochaetaceae bacterium]
MSAAAEPVGLVARILPFSAVDGPGNRAVVFLQGCDFDCSYCHNPETRAACSGCGACLAACPAGALADSGAGLPPRWDQARCRDCGACAAACALGSSPRARRLSVGELLGEIERYRPFLRGITVSGGECTLQPDFLAALLEASRARGLPGLVDTNGGSPLAARPRILAAAEGFMLDVKAWDPAEHRALTGADNAPVLENLRFLAGRGALFEVRTVLALRGGGPGGGETGGAQEGAFDLEGTVRETARVLARAGSRARYRLIRYRPYGVRAARAATLAEPDPALAERLAELARREGAAEVFVS